MSNPTTVRRVLESIPYGLYVIGVRREERDWFIVANWVTQVSFSPTLIATAVENDSQMKRNIEEVNLFSLNLLPSGSKSLAAIFVKEGQKERKNVPEFHTSPSRNGSPFLSEAAASLECTVLRQHSEGDHTLFIAEITDAVARESLDSILTLKETGWRYSR
jgi:flavin reductase (DIM6/NTAB) family NADH-FMN oxidoreductase RutF